MNRRLRLTAVAAWLVLGMLSIVGGGQHVIHYSFAHEETHHYYENSCCKPDHRLPHIHEAKYCALCDVDVSVVMFSNTMGIPEVVSVQLAQVHLLPSTAPHVPEVFCLSLRGPPAMA